MGQSCLRPFANGTGRPNRPDFDAANAAALIERKAPPAGQLQGTGSHTGMALS